MRVQVRSFETHIMVMMLWSCPKVCALSGKVIFIRAKCLVACDKPKDK